MIFGAFGHTKIFEPHCENEMEQRVTRRVLIGGLNVGRRGRLIACSGKGDSEKIVGKRQQRVLFDGSLPSGDGRFAITLTPPGFTFLFLGQYEVRTQFECFIKRRDRFGRTVRTVQYRTAVIKAELACLTGLMIGCLVEQLKSTAGITAEIFEPRIF